MLPGTATGVGGAGVDWAFEFAEIPYSLVIELPEEKEMPKDFSHDQPFAGFVSLFAHRTSTIRPTFESIFKGVEVLAQRVIAEFVPQHE